MNFFAADAEALIPRGGVDATLSEGVLAATISLAWHLRQRDSARALRLVDGVILLLAPTPDRRPAPPMRTRARAAALAACEASALLCDFEVAERWLADARRHLDTRTDPCAEGDAWLVECVLAKMRVQREREMAAHTEAIVFFGTLNAPDRLAIARIWRQFRGVVLAARRRVGDRAGAARRGVAGGRHRVGRARQRGARPGFVYREAMHVGHRSTSHVAPPGPRAVPTVRLEIIALINSGAATQGQGDYDLAAECFDLAAARANATGWPTLIGAANTRVGELMQTLGAFEESRSILNEAIVALSIGAPGLHLAIACASLAQTLLLYGAVPSSLQRR